MLKNLEQLTNLILPEIIKVAIWRFQCPRKMNFHQLIGILNFYFGKKVGRPCLFFCWRGPYFEKKIDYKIRLENKKIRE